MDIKLRKYSHSVITKLIAFVIVILCFASSVTIFSNIMGLHNGNFGIAFEESYYTGNDYMSISSAAVGNLRDVEKYKSEEYILSGKTLSSDEITNEEDQLFNNFRYDSKSFNPNLTDEENQKIFKESYADKLSEMKARLINRELNHYHKVLRSLEEYQGLMYYAKDNESEFTNSANKGKEYFKSFPAYMIFDASYWDVFPKEVSNNSNYYSRITFTTNELGQQDVMYIAFTQEFLNPRIEQWKADKEFVTNSLHQLAGFLSVLAIAFIYLVWVIGIKPQKDQGVQLNAIDRIYNDLKIGLCMLLIALWVAIMIQLFHSKIVGLTFPITLPIAIVGLVLVLSLAKHLKNGTFIKHTFIYSIFHKLYKFIEEVYNNGSVGVKVILIVIGYPVAVALTFFMFPVTIGAAAWVALKKVKEFKAIKEGVKQVRDGDIRHKVTISGEGEFAKLAADINSITDGLHTAVENGIKSERLKAELITNVSHDIRTPLTSIITYVDLLKSEKDPEKVEKYIEIIDRKSQHLKVLTEDLFEATKASSGSIPVNFERIDLVSLITQGLGELGDKIQERNLDFKLCHPTEKVFITADGKLMWRATENLLSNVFKYALEGSRVYLDIIDVGPKVKLIIKNISTYELNISPDELMERFKRGDDSRNSQGSGLGLSITKSLIEIQKGSFKVEIDGDLFKAIIEVNKAE
ncbi:MAG TPA: HAMP domain-containing sensor histidine kinase [Desulfosporosinus sp.]|nr:HAMP domain-containing sensor histidine kinase [Desulfosporosinus sp.]